MSIQTTPVQNQSVLKALQLNRSVRAASPGTRSSFGRDLVSFSPVSIAVNQAYRHAGLDSATTPLTSLELLRGRASGQLRTFSQFVSSAAFTSTLSGLASADQAEVTDLVTSILADGFRNNSATLYDRLGRISTLIQDSEAAPAQSG